MSEDFQSFLDKHSFKYDDRTQELVEELERRRISGEDCTEVFQAMADNGRIVIPSTKSYLCKKVVNLEGGNK